MSDLLSADSHFAFGKNWRSFAQLIGDDRISQSDEGIARLFAPEELTGREVIDIGCGSGLPALSILRAGAKHVSCVDIDADSVAATRATLSQHAPESAWSAEVRSVFDLTGRYDVVHSWGVLHHTGAMWPAIDKAASLVKPGGLLAIAIYCKTPLCGLWKVEKRIYSRAPRLVQNLFFGVYFVVFCVWSLLRGRSPLQSIRDYSKRGMSWSHDARDWLGGYPYESATPAEVEARVGELGFEVVRQKINKPGLMSICDEYVFVRRA